MLKFGVKNTIKLALNNETNMQALRSNRVIRTAKECIFINSFKVGSQS